MCSMVLHLFDNSFFIPFNRLIWYSNHRIDEVQNKREETITTMRKCRAGNYIIKTIRRSAHMNVRCTHTLAHIFSVMPQPKNEMECLNWTTPNLCAS